MSAPHFFAFFSAFLAFFALLRALFSSLRCCSEWASFTALAIKLAMRFSSEDIRRDFLCPLLFRFFRRELRSELEVELELEDRPELESVSDEESSSLEDDASFFFADFGAGGSADGFLRDSFVAAVRFTLAFAIVRTL